MLRKNDTRYSIIIADDDADDQFLIKQAIREINQDHELTSVHDGIQLMDLLLKRGRYKAEDHGKPDLILLDINMPLMDGFQVLSNLKKTDHLKDIPVFILSTSRSDSDIKKSIQLGAERFYSKPSQYAQLKGIIDEICSQMSVSGKLV